MGKRLGLIVITSLAVFVFSVSSSSPVFVGTGNATLLVGEELSAIASTAMLQSSEKLLPMKQNGKWGYIDKNANIVIQPQYGWAEDFIGDIAAVKIDNKW